MTNSILVLIFIFNCNLCLCQTTIEYWTDTIKKSQINYVNNKKEGKATFWYKSGNKKSEYLYKNGVQVGLYREWYSNAILEVRGEIIRYDTTITETTYTITRCDCVNFWYPSGLREITSKVKNNSIIRKEYYENGIKKCIGRMNLHCKYKGVWKYWNVKGDLIKVEKYKNGELKKTIYKKQESGVPPQEPDDQ